MRAIFAILLIVLGVSYAPAAKPYVLVLGIGQDAGVPQMGCDSPFCKKAWANAGLRRAVSSIALVDPSSKRRWIFDATPDLPEQFELLKAATGDRSNSIDGIFLTHAHIGHYTGLMYLGRESLNSKNIPVFAMPRMRSMLEANAPWSQLSDLGNVKLIELKHREIYRLGKELSVEPFLVPHRDEFSETVGYRIRSGENVLVFIPDIDKWEKWDVKLGDLVSASDHVLIDGTFFADGEINRPMSEVPHPFIVETMSLLRGLPVRERRKVKFIHLNHSNPLIQGDRAKIAEVNRAGFGVAAAGMRLPL